MAALAHLPLPAQSQSGAEPTAAPHILSAESARTEAPLTSEPPLPDAEPLTSEPSVVRPDPTGH
ncbi:hypothetical protein [Streptomyces sp. NPDC001020]